MTARHTTTTTDTTNLHTTSLHATTATTSLHSTFCLMCETSGRGECINGTQCKCFEGFGGLTCSDDSEEVTVLESTSLPDTDIPTLNIGAIVAGVLGGVLLTVIIGLILFCWWKRRRKKKEPLAISLSTTSTAPVIVPALYDFPVSRHNSSSSSVSAMNYHIYEDL